MRKRFNFFLKLMSLIIILGLTFYYVVSPLIKMAKEQNNYDINLAWWGPSYRGFITLKESSLDITYGNENPKNNEYTTEKDCYVVVIDTWSTDSISATTSNNSNYLSFKFEDATDSSGNAIKLMYIYGLDKEPANSFGSDSSTYNPTIITVKCASDGVYAVAYAEFKLYVFPKEVTEINWINNELIYNGKNQVPLGEPVGLINDDNCSIVFETEGEKNVGNKYINVVGLSNTNYYLTDNLVNTTTDYCIKPAPLFITPTLEVTYGNELDYTSLVYDFEGLCADDSYDISSLVVQEISYNAFDPIYDTNGNIIDYAINVNVIENTNVNYDVTILQGSLKVNPAPIEVEYNTEILEIIYGDALNLEDITYTYINGLLKDDTLDDLEYELSSSYKQYSQVLDTYGNPITYSIALTTDKASNYEIISEPINLKVNPAPITIDFIDSDYIYNGKKQLPKYEINGLLNNDTCYVVFDTDGYITSGDYVATVVGLTNSNYYVSNKVEPYSYTINKATLALKLPNINVTYGDALEFDDIEYTVEGLADGEELDSIVSLTLTTDYQQYSPVYKETSLAQYKLKFEDYEANTDNYIIDITQGVVTVNPKAVDIIWTNTEVEYTGEYQLPTANIKGLLNNDSCNVILPNEIGYISSGTYTIEVLLDNNNYVISTGKIIDFIIKKLNIADFKFENQEMDYFGVAYNITSELPQGIVEVDYSITLNDNPVEEIKNVGIYKVVASYTVEAKYNEVSSKVAYITINPKKVQISWSNINVDYNGRRQLPTATVIGLLPGEECNAILSNNIGYINAGEYNVTVTSVDNTNYVLDDNYTTKFIINKINVDEFEFNDVVKEYNGRPYEPTIFKPLGVEDVLYTITLNGNQVDSILNVGKYEVTAQFIVNDNYYPVDNKVATVVINPKGITIVLDYSNLTYNGSQQTINVKLEGAIEGEDLEESITGNTGTSAGSYNDLSVSFGNPNYVIIGEAPSWTIDKADITLDDYEDLSQTYTGQPFVLPSDLPVGVKEIKYTVTTYDGMVVANIVNAGKYNVVADFIPDENHNDIANEEFTVTIDPKELTVIFEFVNPEYTGEEKSVDVRIEGGVSGEIIQPLITGGSAMNIGDYNTTVTIDDPNYVVSGDSSFEWSITKATAKPHKLEDVVKVYDGQVYELPTELAAGITAINYNITLNGKNVEQIKNAGVYSVTAEYTVDPNYYDISSKTISITVNKKELSVIFDDEEKFYTGQPQEVLVTLMGVIDGDKVNIELEGNKGTSVGSYTLSVVDIDNPNYVLVGETSFDWEIKEFSQSSGQGSGSNSNNSNDGQQGSGPNSDNSDNGDKNKSDKSSEIPILIGLGSTAVIIIVYFMFEMKKNITKK